MEDIELICKNLSKSYSGKSIFKNLSLSLKSRQSIAVTGRNGSGKSTLIKVLANLIQASKGQVIIRNSKEELPKEKWYKKTGLISPYLNLYDELTGLENLEFFYKLKADDASGCSERVNYYLQKVNLFERRNELLKNYSSGMKQRLKLAFAVMNEPEILFLDEPRSNLDKSGIGIVNELATAHKANGILVIATNDEEDKLLCDDSVNIENYQ